jgi:YjjG family noncanonical pyrimidine nucleotidase
MKYSWIIFDADGTLFDYDRAEYSALTETFQQFKLSLPGDALSIYRKINGSLFSQFENGEIAMEKLKTERFARLFESLGMSIDSDTFAMTYLKNLAQNRQLLPEAESVVKKLSEILDLIMLTNGMASVQRPRLGESKISHCFKDLVISEEEGFAKPAKEIFEITFKKMGNPLHDQVLIVGDCLTSDIAGGNSFGIDTCWYCPDTDPQQISPATYRITCLSELPDIMRKA